MEITFEGGFAWVFDGGKKATVSLVDEPKSKFNHRMVLEVPTANVDTKMTTIKPSQVMSGKSSYVLDGDVRLEFDGVPVPTGPIGKHEWDRTFAVKRIVASGVQPNLPDDWRQRTSVRLELTGGNLKILHHKPQACSFVDGNGKKYANVKMLSKAVKYTPKVAPQNSVTFRAKSGVVVIVPNGGKWPAIGAQAECNCNPTQGKVGEPLPGFIDVYYLYMKGGTGAIKPEFVVSALGETFLSSTVPPGVAAGNSLGPGMTTPGPDCPLTEHFE